RMMGFCHGHVGAARRHAPLSSASSGAENFPRSFGPGTRGPRKSDFFPGFPASDRLREEATRKPVTRRDCIEEPEPDLCGPSIQAAFADATLTSDHKQFLKASFTLRFLVRGKLRLARGQALSHRHGTLRINGVGDSVRTAKLRRKAPK